MLKGGEILRLKSQKFSERNKSRLFTGACCLALFTGIAFYYELIFQLFAQTIGTGFLRAAIFCFICAAVFSLIISALPKLAALIVSEIILLFLAIVYISQLLYFKIFQEFCSIDKVATGVDAITQFGDILLTAVWSNVTAILLMLLPAAAFALLYRLRRVPFGTRLPVKYALPPVIALIALHVILLAPIAGDPYSARAASYGQGDDSLISSVREVGLIATMEIDLISGFIDTETSSVLEPIAPLPAAPPIPDWVDKVNGFDIDFDSLIERDAGDNGLIQLHEYFASLKPGGQNEKTGIFEGYNLITICAEAFTHYVIDPELTPTLYMMQQEGIYFENFYSLSGGSTIGGEVGLITGLAPRGAEVWCGDAAKKYLPFSFASQFKALGIQPYAYHNGTYTYYDRNILFPDLGYVFRTRGHGLDFQSNGWHMSDRLMIELSIDQYIDMDRFYVHYMTISGHTPYSFEKNPIAGWNREAVNELPYSPQVRAYLACQLELEYAMKYLLERLEEKGKAGRTLIVMTTDHYPYGLAARDIAELAGHSLDSAFGVHKNACIIYAGGIEHEVVETPTFVPDILPTVSNLLGFRFDSRFLSGRDVFSDAMPLVFLNGGFVTDLGCYDRKLGQFTPVEGADIPEGYVSAISTIADMRRSAVERIVRLDYFAKIADYLN